MKFIEGHLFLKKRPAEFRLIVDVRNLRDGLCLCCGLCAQPSRDRISAVPELLKERGWDSEEVNASERLDLTNLREIDVNMAIIGIRTSVGIDTDVTEWCAHHDGLVTMLLVIIEDTLDRLYTRVFITFVSLPSRLLVPVEDLMQQQG
jgi:hypothetical protein